MKNLIALSAMTLAISQAHGVEHKIIGGTQAGADAYPWAVSLQHKNGQHFCGASLLDSQWVLTAAHCVEQEAAASIQAVISEYNLKQADSNEQKVEVEAIYLHADFDEDHDIAVLKLKTASDKTAVAAANKAFTDSLAVGTNLTAIGWGNTSADGESFPDILQQVELPLYNQADCKTAYDKVGVEITANMICAGVAAGGKDSCQGDSGGPLVIQSGGTWTQVGIVSFGEACAKAEFPGVYTRLANYEDWIAKAKAGEIKPHVAKPGRPFHIDKTVLGLPMYADFFAEDAGGTDSVSLTIENPSDASASLQITSMSLEEGDFALSDNQCDGQSIEAGKNCSFKLTYTAKDGEEFSEGMLTVKTNHSEHSELKVDLLGFNEAERPDGPDFGCDIYAELNIPDRMRPGPRPDMPEGGLDKPDFEFEGEIQCNNDSAPGGNNNNPNQNEGGDDDSDDDTTTVTFAGAWNPASLLLGFMLLPWVRRRK